MNLLPFALKLIAGCRLHYNLWSPCTTDVTESGCGSWITLLKRVSKDPSKWMNECEGGLSWSKSLGLQRRLWVQAWERRTVAGVWLVGWVMRERMRWQLALGKPVNCVLFKTHAQQGIKNHNQVVFFSHCVGILLESKTLLVQYCWRERFYLTDQTFSGAALKVGSSGWAVNVFRNIIKVQLVGETVYIQKVQLH